MHSDLTLSASILLGFALVLSRMAGVFVFIPLPSQDAGPGVARIAIALACTLALFPRWPAVDAASTSIGLMALWMISELALGTAIGLMVSFISESMTFGAQLLGLQAGYGYASVVDPTTQADSNVLPVLVQLTAGLLFFTTGLYRYVIAAFVASLDAYPPGNFVLNRQFATTVVQLGSNVFSVGLRLALPVVALLLMTDLALAVIGRISSQLQMGNNAFPLKMLLTLFTLVTTLALAPSLYESFSAKVFETIQNVFRH
ncbi:MAG: flagellar biosynthetic protein FliR [Bryobacteraceae bacterium]